MSCDSMIDACSVNRDHPVGRTSRTDRHLDGQLLVTLGQRRRSVIRLNSEILAALRCTDDLMCPWYVLWVVDVIRRSAALPLWCLAYLSRQRSSIESLQHSSMLSSSESVH